MPPAVPTLFLICALCLPAPAFAGKIVINAVGDIMLAGKGSAMFSRRGYDYPFAGTSSTLKNGDVTIGNLEAPLTQTGRDFKEKKFRFKADPHAAAALKRAGFSVLTLANNHILDFGSDGLRETIHHLDRQGILHSGAGETLAEARREALVTSSGVKIAFLAYSLTFPPEFYAGDGRAGTAPGYRPYYLEDIARARGVADYVVVSFHWGEEKAILPKSYQVTTAHRAVDAGADLVLGHHPHVLQGIERYRNAVIFYSLGNFAFGSLSSSSDRSVIARITLDNGVNEVELIPLNVLNSEVHFQPRQLTGDKGREVIERLNTVSQKMGTVINDNGGRYLVDLQRAGQHLVRR
jgi:poly-gamma-glutamate capsule biosynthesis protein CapA/YwtB (metallophosphatase superfamily)